MIKDKEMLDILRLVLHGQYVSQEESEEAHRWIRTIMLQAQEHGFTEADVVRSLLWPLCNNLEG